MNGSQFPSIRTKENHHLRFRGHVGNFTMIIAHIFCIKHLTRNEVSSASYISRVKLGDGSVLAAVVGGFGSRKLMFATFSMNMPQDEK